MREDWRKRVIRHATDRTRHLDLEGRSVLEWAQLDLARGGELTGGVPSDLDALHVSNWYSC